MRPIEDLPYLEWENEAGSIERVYADAWIRDDIDARALITDVPVQSGARVTDHYVLEPLILNATLFFSEEPIRADLDAEISGRVQATPLQLPEYPNLTPLISPGGITKAASGAIGAAVSALGFGSAPNNIPSVLKFDSAPGRLRRVMAKLLDLRESRTVFAVGSSVLRVESLGLERVHLGRSKDDGSGGSIECTFKQLVFVQTLTAEPVPIPVEPRGQDKKASKSGASVPNAAAEKSLAKKALDALRGGG